MNVFSLTTESLKTVWFTTGNCFSAGLFLHLVDDQDKLKEERKCLHQCPASIFPFAERGDWSLPRLISSCIWQAMFNLIKTFGKRLVPRIPAFPPFKYKVNYLANSFLCKFAAFGRVRKELTWVRMMQDLRSQWGLIKSACKKKNLLYMCHSTS